MKNKLVAHRGDMTRFIENTMPAIEAAVQLGMQWIEIDVQISTDHVPMVVHDDCLQRLASRPEHVSTLTSQVLGSLTLSLSAPNQTQGYIPSLEQVIDYLNTQAEVTLFVEVKKESVTAFGVQTVMEVVSEVLQRAKFPVVLISFLYAVVEVAKANYRLQIGWVLADIEQATRRALKKLQPEFVFCEVDKAKHIQLFKPDEWQWVLYDVKDPREAYAWMQKENVMIETGDIFKLMQADLLE